MHRYAILACFGRSDSRKEPCEHGDASREFWLEVLPKADLWHEQTGSLHLAYHGDEAQVLAEFAAGKDSGCEMLTPQQVVERSPAVKPGGLVAGLWSPTETCVDPASDCAAARLVGAGVWRAL